MDLIYISITKEKGQTDKQCFTKILKNYKRQNIHKKITKHSHNGYRSFWRLEVMFRKREITPLKLKLSIELY
jgi:hypothetical protein